LFYICRSLYLSSLVVLVFLAIQSILSRYKSIYSPTIINMNTDTSTKPKAQHLKSIVKSSCGLQSHLIIARIISNYTLKEVLVAVCKLLYHTIDLKHSTKPDVELPDFPQTVTELHCKRSGADLSSYLQDMVDITLLDMQVPDFFNFAPPVSDILIITTSIPVNLYSCVFTTPGLPQSIMASDIQSAISTPPYGGGAQTHSSSLISSGTGPINFDVYVQILAPSVFSHKRFHLHAVSSIDKFSQLFDVALNHLFAVKHINLSEK